MSDTLKFIIIGILVVLLLFSSFFSAAETAYTSVGPAKVIIESKKSNSGKMIKKQIDSFG
jgi:Mg2+/Co2+ transporter CorB